MALTIDQLQIQIVAESTQATQALDALIGKFQSVQTRMTSLGNSGKKAGQGFKEMSSGAVKATAAMEKHRTAVEKSSKSTVGFTDKLLRQITKTRVLYGAFMSVARVMGSWFTESNDYIETLNLFNVTMGEAAESAKAYAKEVEAAMGIDSKDFMQYQGVFKNLTAGFGVVEKDANTMSQNLTQLSYDMASIFNTDVETAFDKLSSAMSGQVKGLREFGIDTSVASLQEYALSQGIDKSVRSMSQAEKAMLRYNYIMEKSIHMQGDMARTIATPANALRILQAQLTRMKRAFGDIISVIATQVIPYVQLFVEVITEAASKLATFFGFDPTDYTQGTEGITTSWGEAEDAVDDYSDSLKAAKKQMMGFDELNIIQNPNSDSTAAGDASGGMGDMGVYEYDFLKGIDTSKSDAIKKQFQDISDAALNMAKQVAEALGLDEVWKVFSDGIAKIDFSSFAENAKTVFFNLKPIISEALDGTFPILKSWYVTAANIVMTLVTVFYDMFAGIMQGFADFTTENKPLIDEYINGIVESTSFLYDSVTTIVGGIFDSIRSWWEVDGKSVWASIVEMIGDLIAKFMEFWNDTIKPIIDHLSTTLTKLWDEHLSPLWNNTLDFITSIWDFLKALWDGILKPIVSFIINRVGPPIVNVFNHIIDVFYTVFSFVADAVSAIMKTFGGLLDFLTGIFTGNWEKAWGGIQKFFSGIWDGFYAVVRVAVNLVIDILNGLWRGLYSVLAGIVNGVGGLIKDIGSVFGADWGWEIPSQPPLIPKLAGGGVVDAGQMFIAREAGPELVGNIGRKTAVANNDQIIAGIESGVYRAMVAANSGNSSKPVTVNATFEIDGEVVGKKVIKYHNGVVMQTGASPLLV